MIELWLGVILLTLLAVSFLCWPLIKMLRVTPLTLVDRQQENIGMFEQRLAELQLEYESAVLSTTDLAALTLELEKTLLADAEESHLKLDVSKKVRRSQLIMIFICCALLPAISLSFYAKYGSAEAVLWSINRDRSHQLPAGQRPTAEQAMLLLEEELEHNPDNAEGWYILAGAYMGSNQFKRGADSFAKVLLYLPPQSPQYASVLGQYAQALFFLDNRVTTVVRTQIERALLIDANEVVSLGLLGIQAFEAQEYQVAINYWNQSLLNAEAHAADALRAGIANAQERMQAAPIATNNQESNKLKVIVDVEVSAQIKNQLPADSVLFVFARAVNGKIPVAALKLRLSELPKQVILDDSLAMMPTAKISLQKKVEVSARISISGQPQAQKGDFESKVLIVDVTEAQGPIKLLINKVVE